MYRFIAPIIFILVLLAFIAPLPFIIRQSLAKEEAKLSKETYVVWSKLNPQVELTYNEWVAGKKAGLIK